MVSTVTATAAEAGEVFTPSLAVAVKLYSPSPRAVPSVRVQAPPAPEVVVPSEVVSSNTSIVRLEASDVPDIVEIAVFWSIYWICY